MSEIANYLRLMISSDKELKTQAVRVFGGPTLISSTLTSGYKRRGFAIYNNSNTASGDIYVGDSNVTDATGLPIPTGTMLELGTTTDINVYLCNGGSGENGDARIIEIA